MAISAIKYKSGYLQKQKLKTLDTCQKHFYLSKTREIRPANRTPMH